MKRKIIGIVVALLMGLGVAVALEAPASAFVYPNRISMKGLCMEAPNPGVPGDQLRLATCNGSSKQVFLFEDITFSWDYYLHPASGGLCLQPGAPSLYGSTIIQWYCGNTSGQQTWILGFAPTDRVLYTVWSRWCMGVENAFAGAYIRQLNCDSPLGRRWVVG